MRGKVFLFFAAIGWTGITPAHAGKSMGCIHSSLTSWDHPRTCGEKNEGIKWTPQQVGSPPHMRGKERVERRIQLCDGITPAHAGKSVWR